MVATPTTGTPAAAQVLGQPWVRSLFGQLAERHAESLRRVGRLRAGSAANHAFWPFHAPRFPVMVRSAAGGRITDVDGHSYLDCHLGFGAQALHGHAPHQVVEAVAEAVGGTPGNGYPTEAEQQLVELLQRFVPHCERFAFLNTGTDATAAAIRLCRAATGRRLVAKVDGALHGIHDLAAHNTAFWYHGHPMRPFPGPAAAGVTPHPAFTGVPVAEPEDLLVLPADPEAAAALVEAHADRLACVLGEAVSSSFPFAEHAVPLCRRLADSCRRTGVPFVLDEVLTGFRYGPGGAAEYFDLRADLYTFGKVISALGLPLSAVGGRADLLEHAMSSGRADQDYGAKTCIQTTHAGTHLALVAAHASLSLLEAQGAAYYDGVRARVHTVQTGLAEFRRTTGIPLRMNGFGDFVGSFGFLPEESYPNYRRFTAAVNPFGQVLLALLARLRGVYMFSVPLLFTGGAHSDDDLDELLAVVTDAALELQRHDFPFVLEGQPA